MGLDLPPSRIIVNPQCVHDLFQAKSYLLTFAVPCSITMSYPQPLSSIRSALVVGGCGFLGHHLVLQLLQNHSIQVSVLDIRTTRNRRPRVSYYDGDLTSFERVQSVIREARPDVIFHTASPIVASENVNLYYLVNVEGTRNLLERAGDAGFIKAFVYTSSASVVHDSVSDLVDADERLPVLRTPVQTEIYSHTKGLADDIVLASNRKYGNMLTVTIRPAAMFGEGDVQMIPQMMKTYETGKAKFQLGSNDNLFDFTYVGNVAYAHMLAAQKLVEAYSASTPALAAERVDGEAFFVTNDEPYPFWDFPRALWSKAGDKTKPEERWVISKTVGLTLATILEWIFWFLFWGRKEPSMTRKKIKFSCITRTYRIDKAKSRLSYKPIVDMKEGIQRGADWYTTSKADAKKAA
jgi:sterol-4alpha-carboxylate 3-dehydrogenase (decarboxylating)